MTIQNKQLKITKLFKKGATKIVDDCAELQEEVRQLEQELTEKQSELFLIQRNTLRKKPSLPKKKEDCFVRPQKIVLKNSIEFLKSEFELINMLASVEVQSYVEQDHCCVVFHMQHPSPHAIKHGLRIDLQSGKKEISSMSLPLGFNLAGVLEEFTNVMTPDCLGAIRLALLAYYYRLEQFNNLKKLLKLKSELFKTLDGSHIEISVFVQGDEESEDQMPLTLMLDYGVYDTSPKSIAIKGVDLPKGVADEIREQCAVFKYKPLLKAFKEAFLTGDGQFKLVHQLGAAPPRPAPRRAPAPAPRHDRTDVTFHPEDCSEEDDDEIP